MLSFYSLAMNSLVALSMLAMSMSANAVSFDFSVNKPLWNKIAICTANEGVTIRQYASTAAPRLAYNPNDIEEFDEPVECSAFWTKSVKSRNVEPILFTGQAPVNQEKDGWLELKYIGLNLKGDGWVSGKYCKVLPVKTLTPAMLSADKFRFTDDGQYAVTIEWNEVESTFSIYVGKFDDGYLVLPYRLECNGFAPSENNKTYLEKNEYGGYYFRFKPSLFENYDFDIRQIPADVLNQAWEKATRFESILVYYCTDEGVGVSKDY